MRMLVLGAGFQGSACAFDLLRTTEAEVTLADLRPERMQPFLKDRKEKRLKPVKLDARDVDALGELMTGQDSVMSALPPELNFDAARVAVATGVHFADLGGGIEVVRQQQALAEQAEAKKVSVMPECGLAPGMVNILAAEAMGRLDQVDSVRLRVGGLPQAPKPPLNYNIVYAVDGVLDLYTAPSWVLRDGKIANMEALSELETVAFPEPVGMLEAFHTGGGISTMPWEFEGRVPYMEYKTLRYAGHAQTMRAIRDLGLLDTDPLVVDGSQVRPRDVFVAAVEPRLRDPNARDLVALQVIVAGKQSGESRTVVFQLLDFYDEETNVSAMMRTTGYSLSITGQMQAGGRVERYGVATAYKGMPFAPYVKALHQRGIEIEEVGETSTRPS
jgi:lysine 6-dehydrogenase